ncbi:nitrite reductase [Diplogelasinospora grovesii]|uniref:Nitrite reductase [NAD(P)H] n=1 Tax=Diplogelasinospora grovesii TaxID=303347 RepID=A0AAN6NK91_9PEZI|nr:nitrite reductase [Diplogelasinospora grovesii]
MTAGRRKKIVVVGLGMVGISFIEKLLKLDARTREYNIVVIGEEPHLAYNRVGLTSFFEHRKVENLYLNPLEWYESILDSALSYHLNSKVTEIHTSRKVVTCCNGREVEYDILVLATGSDAVLPKHTPGHDATGVFVYRTIDDLERLIAFSAHQSGTVGAVVGGGLLGLEAAKAMMDLQCFDKVKVIERNRWVLSRQLDADAGGMVVEQVRSLGVDVLLSKRVGKIDTTEDSSEKRVKGVFFEDGEYMSCSTICFAIGVRPRDELARRAGIKCADRGGGIIVSDDLRTSDSDIYAIGECASWQGQTFGLIAPGVEMADVLAFNLTQAKLHQPRLYKRPDLSTKLKLLGVEVASFGDFFADRDGPKCLPTRSRKSATNGTTSSTPAVKALTYKDPFQNVYKKYIFTLDGKYLLGGMMIGDTKDYVKLVPLVKNQKELDMPPSQLILGASKDGDDGSDDLTHDTQICSCHNVTKGDVVDVVKKGTCKSIGEVKSCTKAGTGCGGCMPLVTGIFNKTMRDMGNEVKNNLCPHFAHSRADLYNIVMVKRLKTLPDVMREAGTDPNSLGCEACKPAVASIFASLWNKHVMDDKMHGLQETNDRFLGNIQRNGTYSVVPRVAGGEITPEKLIVMGQVAKEYNLYTKITGGQRIDMFGAKKQDLLEIWKRLVDAGMESGHAYAKSLRTVKSCVGTTWCRYGIGDSVGMAVRLEERYKSIRAPHKIKGGVSGCVRECAEAQNKDFGLIATDKGFNIFVAGNGGAKPKHSELLARDVPPTDVVPILDRYLMFYIRTADKLQRTARWLEGLPGGIKYLRGVILEDSLGICASLEAQMQELVDSYFDEWAEAINTPSIAAKFRQFANTTDTLETMEVEIDRDQCRPVFWPKDTPSTSTDPDPGPGSRFDFKGLRDTWSETTWQPVLESAYFHGADSAPNGVSATIKRGDTQLAVWRVKGKYYASQQMCPHKRAFVLSEGLIGEPTPPSTPGEEGADGASPWVSCPHHKRNFDLSSGRCLNDSGDFSISTFQVEERADGLVYIRLPPVEELDAALGTKRWMVKKGEAGPGQFEELDKKIKYVGQQRRAKKFGVRPLINGEAPKAIRKPVELVVNGSGCGAAPDW